MELSVDSALFAGLAIALLLATLHAYAGRIQRLPLVPGRATGSFAGGIAVAYVFLHLMPDLAAGNEALGEALDDVVELTPLLEAAIFLVALSGFTLFYGLNRLATRHGERSAQPSAPRWRDPAQRVHRGAAERARRQFRLVRRRRQWLRRTPARDHRARRLTGRADGSKTALRRGSRSCRRPWPA